MTRADSYPGALDRRPSGSWRWRVSINGERISEHWSEELSEEEAARKARKRYDHLSAVRARGDSANARLSQLIKLFREEHLPGLAETSQRGYGVELRAMTVYFVDRGADPRVRELSRGDVKSYLAWRRVHSPDGSKRSEPLSGWTIQGAHAIMSAMLREAVEREWIEANPARNLSPPTPSREYVILSDEEYEDVLEKAEGHPMCWMFLLLCGEAGLRRSEALDLRWSDLDLESGFLTVTSGRDDRQTKSRKSRHVPMTGRLRSALRRHVMEYKGRQYPDGPSPYVIHHDAAHGTAEPGDPYAVMDYPVSKVKEKADVPEEWRVHDLRHRRITEWLREGYSPAKVRKAAGHADLSTTLQYEHLVQSDLEEMVGSERDELEDMVG